ncbi:MAG: hypothetical protein K6E54_01070 [Bacteroidaceae bacterium]|nr:hypothetical protein [Bacteroidaceae bacterium]
MFIVSLLASLCYSCDKSDDVQQTNLSPFEAYVRFLSPLGNNIADSLNLCVGETCDLTGGVNENMYVDVIRESDEKRLVESIYDKVEWGKVDVEHSPANIFPILGQGKVNTILGIRYFDSHVWADNAKESDDVYRINMTSRLLFGDSEIHALRLYVHIYGCGDFKIYKCEFDGMDITTPEMYGIYMTDGRRAGTIALNITVNR